VSAPILLGTHVLHWLDTDDARLGRSARSSIAAAEVAGLVAVSAVTFLELATLWRKGRLRIGRMLEAWRDELLAGGLREVPLDGAIAIRAYRLDDFHADPADRMIVATALAHDAVLMMADHKFLD
jgi:PIN domain nuclease of toxin-antitoxin system